MSEERRRAEEELVRAVAKRVLEDIGFVEGFEGYLIDEAPVKTETRGCVVCPPSGVKKIGEVISLRDFEPQTTDHWLISGETLDRLAQLVKGDNAVEKMRSALDLVMKKIKYDDIHANASRNWRRLAYTYLTGEEAARLGRGICGELSLALVGILRRHGIPASLVRPSFSHIAVVAEDEEGNKWFLDPTTGQMRIIGKEALPRFAKPGSNYVYGPITLDEFAKTTVLRRKEFQRRLRLTPEEALDYEYARHCFKDLPFGTEKGKKFLEELVESGYCRYLVGSRLLAEVIGSKLSGCPRPEEKIDRSCYGLKWSEVVRAWEELRKRVEKLGAA